MVRITVVVTTAAAVLVVPALFVRSEHSGSSNSRIVVVDYNYYKLCSISQRLHASAGGALSRPSPPPMNVCAYYLFANVCSLMCHGLFIYVELCVCVHLCVRVSGVVCCSLCAEGERRDSGASTDAAAM